MFRRALIARGGYRRAMNRLRFRVMSRWLALLLLSALGPSALAVGEPVSQIVAGDLQLTLGCSAGGIHVDRLLDTRSGQELLATNPLPLFALTLRQTGSTNQSSLAADVGWNRCTIRRRGRRFEL